MVNAFRGHTNKCVLFLAIILMCADNFCDLTASTVDSQSNAIARIFAGDFKWEDFNCFKVRKMF